MQSLRSALMTQLMPLMKPLTMPLIKILPEAGREKLAEQHTQFLDLLKPLREMGELQQTRLPAAGEPEALPLEGALGQEKDMTSLGEQFWLGSSSPQDAAKPLDLGIRFVLAPAEKKNLDSQRQVEVEKGREGHAKISHQSVSSQVPWHTQVTQLRESLSLKTGWLVGLTSLAAAIVLVLYF